MTTFALPEYSQAQVNPERRVIDRLLLPAEVCDRIRLSLKTIYRLRRMNQFPEPMVVGQRRLAWRESDIERWLASRTTASLAAP